MKKIPKEQLDRELARAAIAGLPQVSEAGPSAGAVASTALHEYRREPVDRLLKIHEVVVLTGMCRSSVYNRLRDGDFVGRVKIGPRSIRFPESEVRRWIAERLLERDTKGGRDARA